VSVPLALPPSSPVAPSSVEQAAATRVIATATTHPIRERVVGRARCAGETGDVTCDIMADGRIEAHLDAISIAAAS
jgi:hypothetical protein